MLRILLITALSFILPLTAAHAKRYALVIGNSHYGNAIGDLKNPVNDAKDMAAVLAKKGFSVTTLTDANQREMKEGITQFTQQLVEKHSMGLFFFAGHGMELDGHNFLIPIGAKIESESDIPYEGVDSGRVMGGMEASGNDLNLIILDACRNNPFARSFRSASKGLARVDPPKGSLILYATSPGEVAADGTGKNGLFTQHLLKAIDQSNVPVEKVFKITANQVFKESAKKQLPWQSGVILGEFYFSQTDEKKPAPSNQENNDENIFWASIQSETQAGFFKSYLEKYPKGKYAAVANLKIQQFEGAVKIQKSAITNALHAPKKSRATSDASLSDTFLNMDFVSIKADCFAMGGGEELSDEVPEHKVCITQDYVLGKYEVTQAQWLQVMGNNPSKFIADNKPVESVSWNDVQTFIAKLNQQTGLTYRLPTEAEWEYACRAKENNRYCGSNSISNVAWYDDNANNRSHEVGERKANALGLYDMTGNVAEWVEDWYAHGYYENSALNNPKGALVGTSRVVRGGSWSSFEDLGRTVARYRSNPDDRFNYLGFRLARTQ